MRDWWPFIAVCGIAVALLSFWAGAVTVTGVAPGTAPHGIVEYWTDRYQTVLASLVALFGAAVVVMQIRENRKQHRANVRLALRNEYDAVASAIAFGEEKIAEAALNAFDNARYKRERRRFFREMDVDRRSRIEQLGGEPVKYRLQSLLNTIERYEAWRDEGSNEAEDLFSGPTGSFEERIDDIFTSALHLVETSKIRIAELEKYGG